MNIKEAKNEIKNTVRIYLEKDGTGKYVVPRERQRPTLLIGAPGIGKTAVMSAVAEELGIGFLGYTITHHTRQSAIGLPFIAEKQFGGKKYSVTEYTMSEIVAEVYDAIERQGKKEGILFIDEINCVSETLAPAMLELLQHKKFGTHYVPDGWVLTAAGNPEEYNKSVNELDMVTLDRVRLIKVEPDAAAFAEYAEKNGIHKSITAFLSLYGKYVFVAEKIADGFSFVTPRGWEDLSVAIYGYEKLGVPVTREFIAGYVQSDGAADEFYGFYKIFALYGEKLNFSEIEKGAGELDLGKADVGEKLAVAELLKTRAEDILSAAAIENSGEAFKAAAEKTENILIFAEKSLGKGQELVTVMTGLMSNENFVKTLAVSDCPEFYRLNSELLLGGEDLKKAARKTLEKR